MTQNFPSIQAIGDGGQGWGNFILYVVVSEKIRKKLLTCCLLKKQPPMLLPPERHLQERSSSTYPIEGHIINYGGTKSNNRSAVANDKVTSGEDMEIVDSYEPTTV